MEVHNLSLTTKEVEVLLQLIDRIEATMNKPNDFHLTAWAIKEKLNKTLNMEKPFLPCFGMLTSYGYPGDSTPDTNSTNAIGAWDNHLSDSVSMAVSRDVEHDFRNAGLHPLGAFELQFHDDSVRRFVWADRTAVSFNSKPLTGRFDVYCAHRPDSHTGKTVVGFRLV